MNSSLARRSSQGPYRATKLSILFKSPLLGPYEKSSEMDSGYSGYSGWPILWARVFLFEKGKVLTKGVPYFFVVDPMNYPDTLVAL